MTRFVFAVLFLSAGALSAAETPYKVIDNTAPRFTVVDKTAKKEPCDCGDSCKCPGGCPLACPVKAQGSPHVLVGGGSGVVVKCSGGKSLVLTCRHCVGNVTTVFVSPMSGGDAKLGRVVAYCGSADLSLVEVDAEYPAATFASAASGPLTRHGRTTGITQTTATGNEHSARFGPVSVLGGAAVNGDSGGAVVDAKGHLVGITCAYRGSQTLAVDLATCRGFVAAVEELPKQGTVQGNCPGGICQPGIPQGFYSLPGCANGSCPVPQTRRR